MGWRFAWTEVPFPDNIGVQQKCVILPKESAMERNEDKIMETGLRKAMRKALRKLAKEIGSEPARTIIESNDARNDISEQTAGEIMAWLFRRGDDNDSPGN
jgi:hypothetical protein